MARVGRQPSQKPPDVKILGLEKHSNRANQASKNRFFGRGSDGFNVMFPFLPAGLDDFVDKVVPELQRRGIFRKEYEGTTLRENLGLPRPKNRFFEA